MIELDIVLFRLDFIQAHEALEVWLRNRFVEGGDASDIHVTSEGFTVVWIDDDGVVHRITAEQGPEDEVILVRPSFEQPFQVKRLGNVIEYVDRYVDNVIAKEAYLPYRCNCTRV